MTIKTASDFLPTWIAAFEAGDLDGLLATYTDEVVAVPQPGARLTGKAELAAGLGAFLGLAPYELTMTQDALVEGAGTAVIYGTWSFAGTSPDGPVSMGGKAVIVVEETEEGWKASIDDFFGQG